MSSLFRDWHDGDEHGTERRLLDIDGCPALAIVAYARPSWFDRLLGRDGGWYGLAKGPRVAPIRTGPHGSAQGAKDALDTALATRGKETP